MSFWFIFSPLPAALQKILFWILSFATSCLYSLSGRIVRPDNSYSLAYLVYGQTAESIIPYVSDSGPVSSETGRPCRVNTACFRTSEQIHFNKQPYSRSKGGGVNRLPLTQGELHADNKGLEIVRMQFVQQAT